MKAWMTLIQWKLVSVIRLSRNCFRVLHVWWSHLSRFFGGPNGITKFREYHPQRTLNAGWGIALRFSTKVAAYLGNGTK